MMIHAIACAVCRQPIRFNHYAVQFHCNNKIVRAYVYVNFCFAMCIFSINMEFRARKDCCYKCHRKIVTKDDKCFCEKTKHWVHRQCDSKYTHAEYVDILKLTERGIPFQWNCSECTSATSKSKKRQQPDDDPCAVCRQPIRFNHYAVQCQRCRKWQHTTCNTGKLCLKDIPMFASLNKRAQHMLRLGSAPTGKQAASRHRHDYSWDGGPCWMAGFLFWDALNSGVTCSDSNFKLI